MGEAMKAQQAMDGSSAVVSRTLRELADVGKFKGQRVMENVDDLDKPVILIRFQCGPIGEVGVNGCSLEDVIDVLTTRLDGFQRGPFACPENANALLHLEAAKTALLDRTRKRQEQNVEGTNAPHVS